MDIQPTSSERYFYNFFILVSRFLLLLDAFKKEKEEWGLFLLLVLSNILYLLCVNNQLAVRAFLLATRIAQRTVLLLTTATNTKLVLLVILVVVVLAR